MFPSFIYKNKDSYEDFGIIINVKPPSVVPENDIEEFPIQGRDGNLTIDYKTKKSYILPLECTIMDESRIEEVKAWLMNTSSELVFSWDTDYKYQARIINKIDISQSLKTFGEFPLMFKVQPYKLSVINSAIELIINDSTIFNPSMSSSKPNIKIFGTGNIDLNINDITINLTNINEYITIDSDLMECYKDNNLMNSYMTGEFPIFEAGNNVISWEGNCSKLEIFPNFRWL